MQRLISENAWAKNIWVLLKFENEKMTEVF